MSNYKYGDWYCKPASEKEAKEIIERALVSGAIRSETTVLFHWDSYDAWGVMSGRTCTETEISYRHAGATEYTIEELRQKFPLPSEKTNIEWNGEGLPPVGTVCDAKIPHRQSGELTHLWVKVVVIAHHEIKGKIYSWVAAHDGFYPPGELEFRPLRTERERWVGAACAVFHGRCMHDYSGQHFVEAMGAVYDAIKSGKIKAPEVE